MLHNPKPLFDAIRKVKGAPLTQGDVDAINDAIDVASGELIVVTAPKPSLLGRRVSDRGVALMHGFEGCARERDDGRFEAYPDPGSRDGTPWTIGYGSTGPDVKAGTIWTRAQCEERFRRDLAKFEDGVTRLLGGAPTTQCQFDALVSIAYNIGLDEDADTIAEGLGDSTLLKRHRAGDYEGAASEFAKWVFNDGRKMKGLERRRAAEAARYRGAA